MFRLSFARCFVAAIASLLLHGCALHRGQKIREPVTPASEVGSPEFRAATGTLLGQGFVGGNNIVTLVNGDRIFPAMLQAIRGARRTINFETYVFWNGNVGRQFAETLAERAAAGVRVNVILDAQGTHKMGAANLARMRQAGVRVE